MGIIDSINVAIIVVILLIGGKVETE